MLGEARLRSGTAVSVGRRGLGMPAPERFRSGRLPLSVTRIPRDYSRADSGSDMDESSDTELDASVGTAAAHERRGGYSSDAYSDLSSSRAVKKPMRSAGDVEVEEDASDFDVSSEILPSNVRSVNAGGGASRGSSAIEEITAAQYEDDVKVASADVTCFRFSDGDRFCERPSAPPIYDDDQDIVRVADHNFGSCNSSIAASQDLWASKEVAECSNINENKQDIAADKNTRNKSTEVNATDSAPVRLPTFHASGQGPWYAVLSYDACVRLCLHAWASGCVEAPVFLENECELLRKAFGLRNILLQSEDELMAKKSVELTSGEAAPKHKKTFGKMKVQVRKVRMTPDIPSRCSFSLLKAPVVKLDSFRSRLSSAQSALSARLNSVQKSRILPHLPANSSFSKHSLAYMHASAQYIKQVSGLLKAGVTNLRTTTAYEAIQETYSCQLRLKSSAQDDMVKMQPGSGETHLFLPESLGDDLIVDVYDSKGQYCGRSTAQVASFVENLADKLRWWSIYHEPEHELVGHLQLYISYTATPEESMKYSCIAETVAYDLVLEAAMRVQQFHQRNLVLHGSWKWLTTEFASYYGVSEAYTKLRYLSYVMDVATPSSDCLTVIHDLLLPVIIRSHSNDALSHQENRLLGEIEEQIEQVFVIVFENYKSLDESMPSGLAETLTPPSELPPPALAPAIKLYILCNDALSPEAQIKLCGYFQAAARKRLQRHFLETDEYVSGNTEGSMKDAISLSTAYNKMKTLCYAVRNEIFTDIEIHNHDVLPSFINLPNLTAAIYGVELCNRLRTFLDACPPTGPSTSVVELLIAVDDFQKDLTKWNICCPKGSVDAKELFHLYIILWIEAKRKVLLDSCKVKWSTVPTQLLTTPFVDEMYDLLKDMLNDYGVIVSRWPEYIFVLENAISDVEKAIIEALERQYADVLSPLKDCLTPKKFGMKYVQKLARRNSICPYNVPDELGILLNTMRRLLDVLRPKIENQLKAWGSCIPAGGNSVGAGERLNEVTVTLRSKFRSYMQAVVEKLAENTCIQNSTKIKKLVQDSKDILIESDIRSRMQPLQEVLIQTIDHAHRVFEARVFVAVCRGLWDRLGQDVLKFLENHKENRTWYKSSRVAVSVLDDTFASEMQRLLGNALQVKDLEQPRSIIEVRSILCKDTARKKDVKIYC